MVLAFYGFLGAPSTSAAYLTLRIRRRTPRWASWIPVVGGVLAGVMLLVLFLAPADSSSGGVRTVPGPAAVAEQVRQVAP